MKNKIILFLNYFLIAFIASLVVTFIFETIRGKEINYWGELLEAVFFGVLIGALLYNSDRYRKKKVK